MCPPRATLTSHAWSSIASSSARPIRPTVSGTRARASTTPSAPRSAACRSSAATTSATWSIGPGWRRTTVTSRPERHEQAGQHLGDATTPDDRHPPVEQAGAELPGPAVGPGVAHAAAQPGEQQGEGQLGDRLGVHALPAGPQPAARRSRRGTARCPAHGSWTQRRPAWSRTARASPSRSLGCAHTSASASSSGTAVPPPATTASSNHGGAPSGWMAMRGAGTAPDSRAAARSVTWCRWNRQHGAQRRLRPSWKGRQMTLTVGVPGEVKNSEHRVAITPDGVRELSEHGVDVLVEQGAGESSAIDDAEYQAAGAKIVPTAEDAWSAELVCKVKEPQPEELAAPAGRPRALHLPPPRRLPGRRRGAARPRAPPGSPTRRCSSRTGSCPCWPR